MLKSVKQKIRLHKIKKEAAQPRLPNATMDDVKRKLELYNAAQNAPVADAYGMSVRYLP